MNSKSIFDDTFSLNEFDTDATVFIMKAGIHLNRKVTRKSHLDKFLKEGPRAIQVMFQMESNNDATEKELDGLIAPFMKLMTMNPITLRFDGYFAKIFGQAKANEFWAEIFANIPESVEHLDIGGIDDLPNEVVDKIPATVHSIATNFYQDFVVSRTGTVHIATLTRDVHLECSKLFVDEFDADEVPTISAPNLFTLILFDEIKFDAPQLEHLKIEYVPESIVLPDTLISFSTFSNIDIQGGKNLLYLYIQEGDQSQRAKFPKLEWCGTGKGESGKICSLSRL